MAGVDVTEEGSPAVVKQSIPPIEASDGNVVLVGLWVLLLEVCQFLVADVQVDHIDLDAG